jgi:hypothetical protein
VQPDYGGKQDVSGKAGHHRPVLAVHEPKLRFLTLIGIRRPVIQLESKRPGMRSTLDEHHTALQTTLNNRRPGRQY